MNTRLRLTSTMALLFAALLIGCASESDPADGIPEMPPATVDTGDHGHSHSHASKGPHDGDLIELGDDDYHAELVDDEDAETVTVYILDGNAEKTVPIEAAEITINLKRDGKGEQFKLAAAPNEGDPAGLSSKFISSDKELNAALHGPDAAAQLVLTIDGKSYRGKIEHGHDH